MSQPPIDFPGYELAVLLHESATSMVWRAVRRRDGQPVILKCTPGGTPTSRQLTRLRNEFALLQSLSIDGVVRAHELVRAQGQLALVAEAGRRLPEFADRPAFVGWGLRDFVFDRHFLDGFRRALPGAEVHAFDDANHYVLEDRHEVLVPAIRAFLDAHPLA